LGFRTSTFVLLSVKNPPAPLSFCTCIDLAAWGEAPDAELAGFVADEAGQCADDPRAEILRAYARYGGGLSAHLLGQYAAVVIDPRVRRVFLVQDSLGVRPLFFALRGRLLWAASRLDLLAAALPGLELDDGYFADVLATGQVATARTPWRGVGRLEMGETAEIDAAGTITRRRPWRPPVGAAEAGDAEVRLRGLLTDAIRACVPRGRNLACELSGGLDSSTVLAFARAAGKVLALTFASGAHPDREDVRYAGLAAAALGSRQVVLETDGLTYFDRRAAGGGEPGSEMFACKLAAIDRTLRAEGVDILLTGWAGDVVFASPAALPHYLADGIATGAPWRSVTATTAWQKHFHGGWTRWFTSYALRSAWLQWRRYRLDIPNVSTGLPPWLDEGFVARMGLTRRWRWRGPRVARPGKQYLWQTIYDIAAMHGMSGRLDMAVETRHPLLHRPLVEFMVGLDESLRHPGHANRVLQRRALAGILPEPVRLRQTKGGMDGQVERDIARDEALLAMLLDEPRLVARGYVDQAAWTAAVNRARLGAVGSRVHFDVAVSVEMWLRRHGG
jgi:asparagine synthase (glutamine-hydrolysing)